MGHNDALTSIFRVTSPAPASFPPGVLGMIEGGLYLNAITPIQEAFCPVKCFV